MAQPYNTGPVDVWLAFTGGTATFLGHGERAPRPRFTRGWEGVFNDLGGTQIPFDQLYEGQQALTTVTFTRWNESVWKQITSIPNPAKALIGNGPGVDVPGDIGTLMITEGWAYQLWLHFPYAAKASMNNAISGAMIPGYRFVASWLEGPDDPEIGTGPNKRLAIFRSLRAFDPSSGNFTLYDYNMSAIGAIN